MNNIINHINEKIIIYLIFLIIPTYLIGIAITEILVLFLIIVFFLKNKSFIFYKNTHILFLISFSLLIAFSGILSLDYIDFKVSAIAHIRFALFSIAICYFLENFSFEKKKLSTFFVKVFLFLIFFINFDSLIQFLLGFNLFGHEIVKFRVSGIFGDELILGSFLLYMLPTTLLLILFCNLDIDKNKIYLIFFFSFYLITVYISGSRTPLFLTIFFVLMIIIFDKKYRNIFLKCLLILTVFISCQGYFKFGKTRVFERVFYATFVEITGHYYENKKLKNSNDNELKSDDEEVNVNKLDTNNKIIEFFSSLKVFTKYHQNHYLLAINLFKEKPFLGHGPKGFRSYCRKVDYDAPIGMCSTHPHNYFFQILSELGLVGILFYLFGLFFIIIKFFKFSIKKKHICGSKFNIISIGLIVILIPIVPSGNFFNNWISIINYYHIGIYFYLYNQTFRNSDLIK